MQEKSFFDKVYDMVCRIPRSKVTSYGQVALLCGNPRGARAVGWALHQNPRPGEIPCHRVVNREGRLAPEFAFGGEQEQRRLLEDEQVPFLPDGRVNLTKTFWYGE